MPMFMVVVCYRAMPVSVEDIISPENIYAQVYTLNELRKNWLSKGLAKKFCLEIGTNDCTCI